VGPISSTQPNPIHRKVKAVDPPSTHNPIELHTTNNKPLGTRKTILIYQSVKVYQGIQCITHLLVFIIIRLSGITSTVKRGLPRFRIFIKMFLTYDPTQPTKKLKISTQPNPIQPNPWVDPTHGELWGLLRFRDPVNKANSSPLTTIMSRAT